MFSNVYTCRCIEPRKLFPGNYPKKKGKGNYSNVWADLTRREGTADCMGCTKKVVNSNHVLFLK